MRMRCYVCLSDYSPDALALLGQSLEVEVRGRGPRPSEAELIELVKAFDVVIIGIKERLTAACYGASSRMRVIGTLSIGTDHIAREYFLDGRYVVLNSPEANVRSVAEYTLGGMLAVAKQLLPAHRAQIEGRGRKGMPTLPVELASKTVGVLGAGRIGSEVLSLCASLRMHRLCWTAHPEKHLTLAEGGVQFVPLDTLLPQADIVTIHLPLNASTAGLLNGERLARLRKGAFLINTSRSSIIDHVALVQALREGIVGGAALDDVEDRDVPSLAGFPNVIVTPHIAGLTPEAMQRMDLELAERISRHVSDKQ